MSLGRRSSIRICIGVLLFLLLGWYIKDTLQYALFYREQQQLFLFDPVYIRTLFQQPGGLAVFLARFVVQFFYSLWAGVILTTFLLGFITLSVWFIIRKIGDYWYTFLLSFIPGLFLMASLFDNNYHYEGITAYLLMVFFLLVYCTIADNNKHLRWFSGCLFTSVLFYLAGAIAFLFAINAFLYDSLNRREYALLSFPYVILTFALGFLAVQMGWTAPYASAYTSLGYYEITVSAPFIHHISWIALPVCLLTSRVVRFLAERNRYMPALVCLAVVVAGVGYFRNSCRALNNPALHAFYQYEYYAVNEQWDQLAKTSARNIRNYNDANYLNLSLAEKGELAEKLFLYPQFGPLSLIYIPKDKTPDVRLARVLFAMGNMAAAQNVAFNASQSLNGYNPAMLKMILQIELMRGSYVVALKYIELLEKTWHYSGWATVHRRFLFNDERVDSDAVLGTGRKDFPAEETFVLSDSPMDDLYKIVDTNPADAKAMQYALSYLLLAKDINHVKEFIDRYYGTPGLKSLPAPAQEALIFFSDYYHTLDEAYAVQHGISKEQLAGYRRVDLAYCKNHGVTQHTIDRFSVFKDLYGKVRQTRPADALAGYKHTFWYYLLFTQI